MAEDWFDDEHARALERVGTTFGGKYHLDALLGQGGMASVYRATHRNGAVFAVKVLHRQYASRQDVRARFLREGYLANSVKHPGVVRVVDDDELPSGDVFIVMDLLDGVSADGLAGRLGGRIPVRASVALGIAVLDVLVAAHGVGVVHRDIKPANVFVERSGRSVLLDFGIARAYDAAELSGLATVAGTILGTPAFMAPEQAAGEREAIGAKSDLWSVGATLFNAISGRTVHEAESGSRFIVLAATRPARPMREVFAQTPDAVAEVVDRALALDPAQRWPDARAMRDALISAAQRTFGEVPGPAELAQLLGSLGAAREVDASQAPTEIARSAAQTSGQTTSSPLADGLFRSTLQVMRDLGVDVDLVLRRCAVDPDGRVGGVPIDAARRVEFFERAAELSGEPSLGLKVGLRLPLGSSGAVDYASRTSSTFGDALARASRLLGALSDRVALRIEEEGDHAQIRVHKPEGAPNGPQIAEFTIAVLFQRAREGLRGALPILSVAFTHARVPGSDDLSLSFGAPVEYEAPFDELVVPRSILAARLEASDPVVADMLERHTQRLGRPT